MTSPFIAVACGLLAEARIAATIGGVRAIAGGGDGQRLAVELERAIDDGAVGVLSFGIAGGLRPDLEPGAVIIARAVSHGQTCLATDVSWTERLRGLVPGTLHGDVVGVDTAVTTVADKMELAQSTGAAVCDMESHIAARIAHARNVPLAVLRVVADPAGRALPSAALAGMKKDGATDAGAVLAKLATRPWQVPALARVGLDSRRAFAALLGCGRRLPAAAAVVGGARLGG